MQHTFRCDPIQVSQWKRQLLDGASELFTKGKKTKEKDEGHLYSPRNGLKPRLRQQGYGSLSHRRSLHRSCGATGCLGHCMHLRITPFSIRLWLETLKDLPRDLVCFQ
jgi:hypothetical protein